MSTAYYSHPECRLHDMGAGHPECPQRLDAISDQLRATGVDIALEFHDAPVATLEQLIAVNPGTPCTENPSSDVSGNSLNPNIWWSATSVSLGTVTDGTTKPAGTADYFTTNANLRVAFTGGNAVKYLKCYVRTNGGSARNCAEIGTGTYVITPTQSDGRVMTFNSLPAIAQRLGFERVFVERGGTVYFGYRNVSNIVRSTVRLNLPAANALLGALGIAAIAP